MIAGMQDEALSQMDQAVRSARALVTGLTLLSHPELSRAGERAPLPRLDAGLAVEVSRRDPVFQTVHGEATAALDDPYLSRRPLRVIPTDDGVLLVPPEAVTLTVDGVIAPPDGCLVAPAALDQGAVLVLGGLVALLLHRFLSPGEPRRAHGLVGDSDAMQALFGEIQAASGSSTPVLLRGESGVEVEQVAAAIHAASARSGQRFVAVNMAALPPGLAAAELSGHARGAVEGVVGSREGALQRARGGTVFLDEVGDAPAEVQAALLRALETGEVQPVGGTSSRIDVRVIAATQRDLAEEVAAGRFSGALVDRLATHAVSVPPLRARRDDIGRLVAHHLRREVEAFGGPDALAALAPAARLWLPPGLVARMALAPWTGNASQLRSVIRQLAIASLGQPVVVVNATVERALGGVRAVGDTLEHLPPLGRDAAGGDEGDDIGDDDLVEALRANRWRVGRTASALGLSRAALERRMEASPLVRDPGDLTFDEVTAALLEAGGDLEAAADRLEVSPRGLRGRMVALGLT